MTLAMPSHADTHDRCDDGPKFPNFQENVPWLMFVDRMGRMYQEAWVQALIQQLSGYMREQRTWLGIDARQQQQRVLDYACGHGTVSAALAPLCPNTRFQGIDVLDAQVARFNTTARDLLGEDEARRRMFAIQGNLQHPGPDLADAAWEGFDVAVISMGLHHVEGPREMMRLLASRVRKDGVLVVVEFLAPEAPSNAGAKHKHVLMEETERPNRLPGFTVGEMEDMMRAVCTTVEIRKDPATTKIPEVFGGEGQVLYAKGFVE